MPYFLSQFYYRRLWRAIIEFDMLSAGDQILVGFSGGKDSAFLLYSLACLKKRTPRPFSLAAVYIDPGFSSLLPIHSMQNYCQSLDITLFIRPVDIAFKINAQQGKDPCYTCSYFRRGAINRLAKEQGWNKVAYAHHYDDAVETFYMSLLYSGQLTTFQPVTKLDRSGVTVIRPLIYFREEELTPTIQLHGFSPIANPCPYAGHTKRQDVKELISRQSQQNPALFAHLAAAMRNQECANLWPALLPRSSLKKKFLDFWENSSQTLFPKTQKEL